MSERPPHHDRPPLTRRLTPQEISDLHDKWADDRKWLKSNYLETPSTPRKPVVILAPSREMATYWRYYYGYYRGDWVDGRVCLDIAREEDLRPSMTSDRWELVLIEGWQETPLAYSAALYTRFPDWLDACEFVYYPHNKSFELVAGTEERIKVWEGLRHYYFAGTYNHPIGYYREGIVIPFGIEDFPTWDQ